jgi:hypothetical protein
VLAVNVTEPPSQNVVTPTGVINAVAPELTLTVAVAVFVHPLVVTV